MKLVTLFLFFSLTNIFANDLPLRGPDIQMEAGNCFIGPFGTVGDPGVYSGQCGRLTNVEKCLAYLKQHIDDSGELYEATDLAKATFCMKTVLGKFVK